MSVNKAILVGRLGRDPEIKFTASARAVAHFGLATDETFKNKTGERQKKTEWHRIVLWEKLAEIAAKYLKKGMLVYIEGRIETHEWEAKDGAKHAVTEIIGSKMTMLEKHQHATAENSDAVSQPAQPSEPEQNARPEQAKPASSKKKSARKSSSSPPRESSGVPRAELPDAPGWMKR